MKPLLMLALVILLAHLVAWGIKAWAKYWPMLVLAFGLMASTANAQGDPPPEPDPTTEETTAVLVAVLIGVNLAQICFNRVRMYA